MTKQTTDTGAKVLVPEGNYEAMITKVVRKEIPGGFIIYEWNFESIVDEKPFYFKLGLFSSQMADLLRTLKATEVSPNRFEWDDEAVVGVSLSFNVVHAADKKGVIREQLSDIVLLTSNPDKVANPEDIVWNN